MRWINVNVGPGAGARLTLPAEVAQCAVCGRREWYAFKLKNSSRLLLQCAHCDCVESADGRPAPELDLYAVADQADDGPLHPLTQPERHGD